MNRDLYRVSRKEKTDSGEEGSAGFKLETRETEMPGVQPEHRAMITYHGGS